MWISSKKGREERDRNRTCTDTARSDKQGNEFFVVTAEKGGRKCVAEAETLMTAYIELQPMLSKAESKGQ